MSSEPEQPDSDNVVDLPLSGHSKESPARILRMCTKQPLEDVVVLGYTPEGDLFICHNQESLGDLLVILRQTEMYYLND